MKKVLLLLMLMPAVFASAQTKEELINLCIKKSALDDDCAYIALQKSEQNINFQKLKNLLSTEELISLTMHKNGVLRMLAIEECINTAKGDIATFLANEFKNNTIYGEEDGCIGNSSYPIIFIYETYKSKLYQETVKGLDFNNKKLWYKRVDDKLASDKTMQKLDSVILFQNNARWELYSKALKNRKVTKRDLLRIEELAFKHNNSIALNYLLEYANRYNKAAFVYWNSDFINAQFSGENDFFHFFYMIELMLKTENKKLKEIVVYKLEQVKDWEDNADVLFMETLKKYGIKIKDTTEP